MKLSIKFRKVAANGDLIDYVNRRISFAFSRTKHAIHSTEVTISDINGPKGGIDKECLVVIKPVGMTRIVISERRANLQQAIDRCITRANQNLTRKIKRNRTSLHKLRPSKKSPIESTGESAMSTDNYLTLEPSY